MIYLLLQFKLNEKKKFVKKNHLRFFGGILGMEIFLDLNIQKTIPYWGSGPSPFSIVQ